MGFNLIWMWDKEKEMSGMLEGLMTTLEWLPPHVGREFAFGDAKEAMAYLQVRFGRIPHCQTVVSGWQTSQTHLFLLRTFFFLDGATAVPERRNPDSDNRMPAERSLDGKGRAYSPRELGGHRVESRNPQTALTTAEAQ